MSNVSFVYSGAFFLALTCALNAPIAASAAPQASVGAKPAAPAQNAVAGEVVSVEGTVFIRQDNAQTKGNPAAAKPGDPVRTGDVVNTSSNGKIKILMKDKSIVDLGSSALFKVDGYAENSGSDRQIDVTLVYGNLRGAVAKKLTGAGRFRVRTPSATMGVRGTEFLIKSDMQNLSEMKRAVAAPGKPVAPNAPTTRTEITVLQGKVEVGQQPTLQRDSAGKMLPAVSAPPPVALTAGAQLTTRQGEGQAPKPVLLDNKQLTVLSSQARIQDNTFTKAVVIEPPSKENQSNPQNNSDSGKGSPSGRAPAASSSSGTDGKEGGSVASSSSSSSNSASDSGSGSSSETAAASGSSGSSSSSNAGQATQSILVSAINIAALPPPPISAGDMGVAGTFGASRPVPPPPVNPNAGLRKVRIVLVK